MRDDAVKVWALAEWGPGGDSENALSYAKSMWHFGAPVVAGIAFDRVTKSGQPIEIALPSQEYL